MFPIKSAYGVQNDLGHQRFGPDGVGIKDLPTVHLIGITAKNFLLTGRGRRTGLNTQKNRDILVTVQAVGDEKWDDDDIWLRGVFSPIRDVRSFLHISFGNFRVDPFFPDGPGLELSGLSRLFVQAGAVT